MRNSTRQIRKKFLALLALVVLGGCGEVTSDNSTAGNQAAGPDDPECIAPSAPGGGFDLTCQLAQRLLEQTNILSRPIRVTYQPGGIGAVAMNSVIAQRSGDSNILVAFSGGSLLNLAQGKFGRFTEHDVKWIAAVGVDYGMIAVSTDSPYQTLDELVEVLREDPTAVVFGAGGTVGSQDWMKSALIAREAGIDYESIRYVPFEGGGEAQVALLGGHIQAYSGDISEVRGMLAGGRLRVLAVMSEERLPSPYTEIPTAMEQGYELTWPVLRGYYTGPDVSDEDYIWWVRSFEEMAAEPEFDTLVSEFGMLPFGETGTELDTVIEEQMTRYRSLTEEFGFVPTAIQGEAQ